MLFCRITWKVEDGEGLAQEVGAGPIDREMVPEWSGRPGMGRASVEVTLAFLAHFVGVKGAFW